jgi:penicillin-binding protein 1A
MFKKAALALYYCLVVAICIGLFVAAGCYAYMEIALPSVDTLKQVKLESPLRIFTADHELIAEYGDVRRIPVTYEQIPKPLLDAVLATEDKRYFEHSGVDIAGLARAGLAVLASGHKVEGGSTITMQVARNFYLTRKKSYTRKIKEILLAIKINQHISKQKVLELYFNKVFLGKHAYGFGAAAQIYYGKPLDQLTLAQYATLAGLPKAPSSSNPITSPERAHARRNHVLARLLDASYITQPQYEQAIAEPVTASLHGIKVTVYAPYVAELIRDYLYQQYQEDIYSLGLSVTTTINSAQQHAANAAVRRALLAYNKRHGYHGPDDHWLVSDTDGPLQWQEQLAAIPTIDNLPAAFVTGVDGKGAHALLADGQVISIPWENMKWAQPFLKNGKLGHIPETPGEVLQSGDVIRVQQNADNSWSLSQIPTVEGALVALDPLTGGMSALVGGLNYNSSNFNRVTQAKRQAGSSFKPFIYTAALDHGLTLASLINDSPIVLSDSGQNALWRPQNDTRKFSGPTRLHMGLVKSLNLVSIRILKQISVPYTIDYLQRFGFQAKELPASLSLALGTATITPLQLARAYSVLANGGYLIKPYLIARIQDRTGATIYTPAPQQRCESDCKDIAGIIPRTISAQTNYLITTALKDVIKSGTGRKALTLKRSDLAGKTGTTNDQYDGWFAGFNPTLVTVAWVGFDTPQSLNEYGGQAALPMWIDFMRSALKDTPISPLKQPSGIVTARINPATGKRVRPGEQPSIYEVFSKEHLPEYQSTQVTTNASTHSTTTDISVADIY